MRIQKHLYVVKKRKRHGSTLLSRRQLPESLCISAGVQRDIRMGSPGSSERLWLEPGGRRPCARPAASIIREVVDAVRAASYNPL
jgi:hypothetical protein